jgi:hypothetical protein
MPAERRPMSCNIELPGTLRPAIDLNSPIIAAVVGTLVCAAIAELTPDFAFAFQTEIM